MKKVLFIIIIFLASCQKEQQQPFEIESAAVNASITSGLYIDYLNTPAAEKRALLGTVTRTIAGKPISASNVKLLTSGIIEITANNTTKTGGIVVTKQEYGYGSYFVKAKPIKSPGATNAFWTFHYEEAYPGTPLYNEIVNEGIIPYSTYVVRNHEIDIETIHPNVFRFNSWVGEKAVNYTSVEKVVKNIYDGKYHDFRFDWYPDRVEYFIDQVKVQTITTDVPDIKGQFWVGVWFPTWAGTGTWTIQKMLIKRIVITPFDGVNRVIPETYPTTLTEIK